jgi:hypothetical protein
VVGVRPRPLCGTTAAWPQRPWGAPQQQEQQLWVVQVAGDWLLAGRLQQERPGPVLLGWPRGCQLPSGHWAGAPLLVGQQQLGPAAGGLQ